MNEREKQETIAQLRNDIMRTDATVEAAKALGLLSGRAKMTEREARLRTGHREVIVWGSRVVHFYWEPYFDDGQPKQGFCIEIDSWMDRIRIENFDEACARLDNLEREIVIQTMVKELIGPQDTVKIRRPPR